MTRETLVSNILDFGREAVKTRLSLRYMNRVLHTQPILMTVTNVLRKQYGRKK